MKEKHIPMYRLKNFDYERYYEDLEIRLFSDKQVDRKDILELLTHKRMKAQDINQENEKLKSMLELVILKSERHIQTSDDFWVFDRGLRMEIIILLNDLVNSTQETI